MAQHNELGAWGEKVAREYLIVKGYTIVEKDTRRGHFEVDVIALKDNRIIFVEVKTRTSGSFDPLDAITPQKIRNICRAANSYVRIYNYHHEVQFDVIAIVGSPDGGYEIEHIPDAFQPPLSGYR
jgi:putative endonuclease